MKDKQKNKANGLAKDRWEMEVSSSVFPKGDGVKPGDAFLPMEAYKRPTPHKKINECDH